MKAIIEKGKADNSIQSCFISECGIEIIFHNNDLAAKFNLEEEVQRELNNGATPLEALREWDII